MLSTLGLSPGEEEIYRCLVGTAAMTPVKIAADTGRDTVEVESLLTNMIKRGLVVPDPLTGEVTAAPPAVALGALLRQRHDDLRAAELDLLSLAEEHRTRRLSRTAGDLVEVITDVDAVRHRFAQIQQAARSEVRTMVVPNLSVVPAAENTAAEENLRRGVRYRVVLDRAALAQPGFAADVARSGCDGEEIRVIDRVPVKMIIVDGEMAMLPLRSGQNAGPESVLVRASGLLDALVAYFEAAWARAYPLALSFESSAESEADTQLLTLLLAGLTDHAVATQLGTSLRSVQRRIASLMERAGVTTRIQLGWYASRNGWA